MIWEEKKRKGRWSFKKRLQYFCLVFNDELIGYNFFIIVIYFFLFFVKLIFYQDFFYCFSLMFDLIDFLLLSVLYFGWVQIIFFPSPQSVFSFFWLSNGGVLIEDYFYDDDVLMLKIRIDWSPPPTANRLYNSKYEWKENMKWDDIIYLQKGWRREKYHFNLLSGEKHKEKTDPFKLAIVDTGVVFEDVVVVDGVWEKILHSFDPIIFFIKKKIKLKQGKGNSINQFKKKDQILQLQLAIVHHYGKWIQKMILLLDCC